MTDDPKRTLVERALAAAERARPALAQRQASLSEVATAADRAVATARAWLAGGDAAIAEAATAATAASAVIGAAWLRWDETTGIARDLVPLKRAIHAAEAAMLAAEAAAWTPSRGRAGSEHDPAELRARSVLGPAIEVAEAERCAHAALHDGRLDR